MILVDMNQISLASVMMHLHMTKNTEPDDNMVRHMILNSLRMYRTRFSSEYGELVLCYDSKHYWRRDFFPQYKAGRRTKRESDGKNWDAIFVGSGCGFGFQRVKLSSSERVSHNCFLIDHPATNCAEAYLLKKETAKAIIDSVYPFNLISDWELAYQFYKLNHKVYWWCPSLIEQGSKNGMYESTLDIGQR